MGVEQVGCVLLLEAQTALLRLASQHRLILSGQEMTASQSRQSAESRSFAARWVQAGCSAQVDLVADHLYNATAVKVTSAYLLPCTCLVTSRECFPSNQFSAASSSTHSTIMPNGSTCMHTPHCFNCHSAGKTLAYLHPQSGARAPVRYKRRQRLHHHGKEHRLSPLHHP